MPSSPFVDDCYGFLHSHMLINPLTTDGKCTCHTTLATHYQLAQSVFEDRFWTSKKGGIGGGGQFQHGVLCTWQLPWLAVEKPCSALACPFLSFLTKAGIDKAPLPF